MVKVLGILRLDPIQPLTARKPVTKFIFIDSQVVPLLIM